MQHNAFGKTVKRRLLDMDKSQKWLIEQIHERTGLYIDGSYLWKILAGKRRPPQIISAIEEILEL